MQYGQLLDSNYNPDNELIYKAFDDYFNHPMMTKIKNVKQYSMYMTKIHTLLTNEYRYLIVFIPKDNNSIGVIEALKNIYWENIQTRTLSENHNLKSHTYIPRNSYPLNAPIEVQKRTKTQSEYKCEKLGLNITMLHKRGDLHEYSNKGTVITSLETYNTVISFNKN